MSEYVYSTISTRLLQLCKTTMHNPGNSEIFHGQMKKHLTPTELLIHKYHNVPVEPHKG